MLHVGARLHHGLALRYAGQLLRRTRERAVGSYYDFARLTVVILTPPVRAYAASSALHADAAPAYHGALRVLDLPAVHGCEPVIYLRKRFQSRSEAHVSLQRTRKVDPRLT
jgi:hypothetical protein